MDENNDRLLAGSNLVGHLFNSPDLLLIFSKVTLELALKIILFLSDYKQLQDVLIKPEGKILSRCTVYLEYVLISIFLNKYIYSGGS